MSVLENNVGVNHHVYQDNFYNCESGRISWNVT
jgi:hypothetical protein